MGLSITITGTVIGLAEDYRALLLILEQRDGLKSNVVAVRCWSNTTKQRAQEFNEGDVVEAYGMLTSRKSKNSERWFSAFEAEGLRRVTAAPQASGAKHSERAADDEPPPADDESDIPF